jgi:hypothetical protein
MVFGPKYGPCVICSCQNPGPNGSCVAAEQVAGEVHGERQHHSHQAQTPPRLGRQGQTLLSQGTYVRIHIIELKGPLPEIFQSF